MLPATIILVLVAYNFGMAPRAADRYESIACTDTITNLREGALKNIVVGLKGQTGSHYIYKGMKRGLNIGKLKSALVNKRATVLYMEPTLNELMESENRPLRITEIKLGDSTVFSEFNSSSPMRTFFPLLN